MNPRTTAITQEVCAIIGTGLFVFGIWQVYHPAAYILSGSILAAPFVLNLRRPV
jgi:hypothetical protein